MQRWHARCHAVPHLRSGHSPAASSTACSQQCARAEPPLTCGTPVPHVPLPRPAPPAPPQPHQSEAARSAAGARRRAAPAARHGARAWRPCEHMQRAGSSTHEHLTVMKAGRHQDSTAPPSATQRHLKTVAVQHAAQLSMQCTAAMRTPVAALQLHVAGQVQATVALAVLGALDVLPDAVGGVRAQQPVPRARGGLQLHARLLVVAVRGRLERGAERQQRRAASAVHARRQLRQAGAPGGLCVQEARGGAQGGSKRGRRRSKPGCARTCRESWPHSRRGGRQAVAP